MPISTSESRNILYTVSPVICQIRSTFLKATFSQIIFETHFNFKNVNLCIYYYYFYIGTFQTTSDYNSNKPIKHRIKNIKLIATPPPTSQKGIGQTPVSFS